MRTRGRQWSICATLVLGVLTLMLVMTGCSPALRPTATLPPTRTPAPTATLRPQTVTVNGPRCPGPFREDGDMEATATLGVGDTLTLTLESAPSVPCWWEPPEVRDESVLQQVAHLSIWPSENVTPKPGAPGTDAWGFEARGAGACVISATCACLGEEGTGEEVLGTYSVTVQVRE